MQGRIVDSHGQQRVVATVYVAAMFMAILDTTIVNVSLPTIGRDLHSRPASVGAVSIAYLVSLTVFIPASGWLGDRIGGRRSLLAAISVFTIASALCGLSTDLGELIAFRSLQGVGGAVMTPVGLSMLFRVYPPPERVRIASVLAAVTALAPALGPVLGGLFTTYLSWRLVFLVNVPVGVAAFAVGATLLASHEQPHPGRLDLRGLLLSGSGLGATIYGASEGSVKGWSDPLVIGALAVGTVLLVTMVLVELRVSHPLIDLRLFHNRLFSATTSVYAMGSVAYLGALYLAALFFQDALGMSAVQAGLTTLPAAIATMAGGQLVTRVLYRRVGPRRLALGGLTLVAFALVLMARVDPGTSVWVVRLIMFGLGLGIAFAFISGQAASMATVPTSQIGRASSLFNAAKQVGGAVGVALLTSVLTAGGSHGSAVDRLPLGRYHEAFVAAAITAVIAAAAALRIRDADAAATMAAKPRPHAAAATPAPSPSAA